MPIDPDQLSNALESAGRPWEMGDTSLSSARIEDVRRRLGVRLTEVDRARMEARQSVQRADQKGISAQLASLRADIAGAPPTFDLRNIDGVDYTTPVRDQGNCGSCVAFGTVATMEGIARYTNRDPHMNVDLSEADLYFCLAAKHGANCETGWWPEEALNDIKREGVAFEWCFPYTDQDQKCGVDAQCKKDNYADINQWEPINGNPVQMKYYISTYGSVIACFLVYEDFIWYKSGVYQYTAGELLGGHCVSLVGYNDKNRYWIAKNSWGAGWGEGGYFRIAYGQVGIEDLGTCGVQGVNVHAKATQPTRQFAMA